MAWQYTPFIWPLLLGAALSTGLAVYAWRNRRTAPGAMLFALLLLAVAEYTLGYVLELSSAQVPDKVFWGKVQTVGMLFIPALWLGFVLEYTGRGRWLTRGNLALAGVGIVVALVLIWTNESHRLFWSDTRVDNSGLFPVLALTTETGFWVVVAYDTLFSLLGTALLVHFLFRSPGLYRAQSAALLIGALAPTTSDLMSVLAWQLIPVDLTPFAFTITGLAVSWGMFRYRLFDLVPVAREFVVESMRDGVIVLDKQGRLVDINKAAQQIIGREASESVGQPAGLVLPEPLGQLVLSPNGLAAQVGFELELQGVLRHYEMEVAPLHDRRGRTSGVVLTLHDISELKRAAEELRQAKETAEQANQAKSSFLASISHELRTPLHSIIGYGELLEEEAMDRGYQEFIPDLERIRTAGKQLQVIINGILDLSKIEAGKMELHLESFDLAALIHDVEVTSQPLMMENSNAFQINCPGDIGPMYSDSGKVRQILLNLVGNAAKFTHQGRVSLTVSREQVGGANTWLFFRVEDSGIGMTEEHMGNLFRAFFQADSAIARQYGGSGLGLAISQRLCQMLGGEISVESTPGQGSTFTVQLPASVSSELGDRGARTLPRR